MFLLDISAATGKAHVAYLRRNLIRAHKLLKAPLGEMSLALVGDKRMAELHERYMNIKGPTDVLTFELDHDRRGRVTAGEVVVCVAHGVREAKKTGVEVRKELLLYALHGMLHLCGFDDRTQRDFVQMHLREDYILKRLGVGAVFFGEMERPTFNVQRSTSKVTKSTSNIEHRTSNVELRKGAVFFGEMERPTFNVQRSTSKVTKSTSNIEHRTSNVELRKGAVFFGEMERPAFNVQRSTSKVTKSTSNIDHRTSNVDLRKGAVRSPNAGNLPVQAAVKRRRGRLATRVTKGGGR